MNNNIKCLLLGLIVATNSGCLGIGGLIEKVDLLVDKSEKSDISKKESIDFLNKEIKAINDKIDSKILPVGDDTIKSLTILVDAINLFKTQMDEHDASLAHNQVALADKVDAINSLILKDQEVVFDMDAFWAVVDKYDTLNTGSDDNGNDTAYKALQALQALVDADGTRAFREITDHADGGIIGVTKAALTGEDGTTPLTFTDGGATAEETAAGKASALRALNAKIAAATTPEVISYGKDTKASKQLEAISNTLEELLSFEMDKLIVSYLNEAFALTSKHAIPAFTSIDIEELKNLTDLLHKHYVLEEELAVGDKLTITNSSLKKSYDVLAKHIPEADKPS